MKQNFRESVPLNEAEEDDRRHLSGSLYRNSAKQSRKYNEGDYNKIHPKESVQIEQKDEGYYMDEFMNKRNSKHQREYSSSNVSVSVIKYGSLKVDEPHK